MALLIDPRGQIVGYTIGNDMSSRDIEGQNPLYLPQAKVYNRSCALGPGILILEGATPTRNKNLHRDHARGSSVFAGETSLAQIKRPFDELAMYLYRDQTFSFGTFLLTGNGNCAARFLYAGKRRYGADRIDGIGELMNPVG